MDKLNVIKEFITKVMIKLGKDGAILSVDLVEGFKFINRDTGAVIRQFDSLGELCNFIYKED